MKNEDKIVELLSEMLKRQDRQEEILSMHSDIFREHTKAMNSMLKSINEIRDDVRELKDEVKEVKNEVRELNQFMRSEVIGRVEKLEQAVFKKGA